MHWTFYPLCPSIGHLGDIPCIRYPPVGYARPTPGLPAPSPHPPHPTQVCSHAPFPPYLQDDFVPIVAPEPVFLNVYGAQELIPRNEFRQPM